MQIVLLVRLVDTEANPNDLELATLRIRDDLLTLDVDNVAEVGGGVAPEGARSVEIAVVGALLVTLAKSAPLIKQVVGVVRSWVQRDTLNRSIELSVGDVKISVQGSTMEQNDQIVDAFLQKIRGNIPSDTP